MSDVRSTDIWEARHEKSRTYAGGWRTRFGELEVVGWVILDVF
jgi:hypothetical protein